MDNAKLRFKEDITKDGLLAVLETLFPPAFDPGWSIIDDTHEKALVGWMELYTVSSRRAMLNILDSDDVRNLSEVFLNSLFESIEDGHLSQNMMVYRNGL